MAANKKELLTDEMYGRFFQIAKRHKAETFGIPTDHATAYRWGRSVHQDRAELIEIIAEITGHTLP